MRTLLIFPPQWNPFHIYGSLPSLQSYLKQRGEAPYLCDANINFYNFLLSNDFRQIAIARVERLLQATASDGSRRDNMGSAREILLHGEEFVRVINTIRDREIFENIHKRREVLAKWDTYLDAISTLYPPLKLTYRGLKIPDLNVDLESIIRFCTSGDDNLFKVYYTHSLRQHVQAVNPDIIGLSVVGLEQVIPSLTLCILLKADFPSSHLTVGGGVFSAYLESTNEYNSLMGTLLDSIILGPGGKPLYELIQALRSTTSLGNIPKLLFKSEAGTLPQNKIGSEDEDQLPEPDYSGLELSAYFHYDPTKSSS